MPHKKSLFVLAVGAVLVGALTLTLTAASDQGQGQYKLGGTWIGKEVVLPGEEGHLWTCITAPLDSAARAASLRVKFTIYSHDMAGLVAKFGADSFSDFVGEGLMFNRDTSQWTLVGYALAQSTLGHPPAIKLILVTVGTWQFTDPDHAVLNYTVTVYPAAADVDGDGMPDPGAKPLFGFPRTDTAQRVPILH